MNKQDFTWFIPKLQSGYAITVPNKDRMNFNAKLLPQLPLKIKIGVSTDGRTLALQADEQGYKIPKNGSLRCPEVIEYLFSKGVEPGVRYSVTEEENELTGTLNSSIIVKRRTTDKPARINKQVADRITEEMKKRR